MADADGTSDRVALFEELEAYRARLRQAQSGKPIRPAAGPDDIARLKRTIADLEAKLASLLKE